MKERDAAVKRAEDMDAQQVIEIQRAQASVDLSHTCLHRVDLALAGNSCFFHSNLTLPLTGLTSFSDCSCQMPGPTPTPPPTKQLLQPAKCGVWWLLLMPAGTPKTLWLPWTLGF